MSKRNTVSTLLVVALLLVSLTVMVSADMIIGTEEMVLPTASNPYDYGFAPDGLRVFLYHGTEPFLTVDIDTSECVVDRLYVYNSVTESLSEICNQAVSAYTTTKDALYYITQSQELYKTDYVGQNQELLYVCEQGMLTDLDSYLSVLYFIENESQVIFLDTVTKEAQVMFSRENVDWAYLLSENELIVATTSEEYFLHEFTTKETTAISGMEANARINAAVLQWNNADEDEGNASLMAVFNSSIITQDNDIPLPLTEYPVSYYDANNFNHQKPVSWFHHNGLEGCTSGNCKRYAGTDECEGFARYAHDVYMHTVNNNIDYYAWLTERHSSDSYIFDASASKVQAFFNTLYTGAYVRYKTKTDYHSIVFVENDDYGVWVYECNQRYFDTLSADEIGNHNMDYFGCGVHLQYYTYDKISNQYLYVVHYVNHTFPDNGTREDNNYHIVECTDCGGYLRQRHTMTRLPTGRFRCFICGYISSLSDNTIQSFRENHIS